MNDELLRDLLIKQIDHDRNNLEYSRCKMYCYLEMDDYDDIHDLFLNVLNKLSDDDYDIKQVYRVIRTIIFEIIQVKKIAESKADVIE